MIRLEFLVRTSLGFLHPALGVPLEQQTPPYAEMDFDGTRFVWHARRPSEENVDPPHLLAPVIALEVPDRETGAIAGAEKANRLMSALAFRYDQPIDSHPGQWYDVDHLTSPPIASTQDARVIQFMGGGNGGVGHGSPTRVAVADDDRLRLALALFREGINAASPFYGFFAFWNALEVAKGDARDQWIDDQAESYAEWRQGMEGWGHLWEPVDNLSGHLYDDARNPIAHPIRRHADLKAIDPDVPAERYRVWAEAIALHWMSLEAIRDTWPDGVAIEL